MVNESTINDLLKSINDSLQDIQDHPTKVDKLPSNFEILVSGIKDEAGLNFLFSPILDKIIEKLFVLIEEGNFEKIIDNEEEIRKICNAVFGKGSFQGPVSTRVLGSIQGTVQSYKYQSMKSHLGKTVTKMKKIRLVMKNLEKEKRDIKDKEELAKYKEALYAIKQVLKIISKIMHNRKLVNRKVYNGLNNIVHEDAKIDEQIEKIE